MGVERMVGAAAVGDFNADGWQDLFVPSDTVSPDRLFLNDGDGTFTESGAAWGLSEIHGGAAAVVGDYDNDGDPDVYVTSFGPVGGAALQGPSVGFNRLYRNDGGSFVEVAQAAGVQTVSTVTPDGFGATFGDPDRDGDLDLFVSGWMPFHQGNRLFINNGDGTFTDQTTAWFGSFFDLNQTQGFSPKFADMNGDLAPELLLVADFGTSRYFRNNGSSFTSLTPANGTGDDTNGMGNAIGDFNADGLLDWYVSSIFFDDGHTGLRNGNKLYINQGNDQFVQESTRRECVDGAWGWGVAAQDFDQDTELDIAETNGWFDPTMTEGAKLFLCRPDYVFAETGIADGLTVVGEGRALITLDADNDADLDIVIVGPGEPLRLFRNNASSMTDAHGLRILLDTSHVAELAPNGFGTRVEAVLSATQTRTRYMDGGVGYQGTSEQSVHFGTGAQATVPAVRVVWSNGDVTTLPNVPVDQTITVTAGGGPGDLDGDGITGSDDLATLLSMWGQHHPGADLNADETVNGADLAMLLAGWSTP